MDADLLVLDRIRASLICIQRVCSGRRCRPTTRTRTLARPKPRQPARQSPPPSASCTALGGVGRTSRTPVNDLSCGSLDRLSKPIEKHSNIVCTHVAAISPDAVAPRGVSLRDYSHGLPEHQPDAHAQRRHGAASGCQGRPRGQPRGVRGESQQGGAAGAAAGRRHVRHVPVAEGLHDVHGEDEGSAGVYCRYGDGNERGSCGLLLVPVLRWALLPFCEQGVPNMDFVVRETRAVVEGPMNFIRFGTCGSVRKEVAPGSVVVSGKGSVMVMRNPDAFFPDAVGEDYYRVSRVMPASSALSKPLVASMKSKLGSLHAEPAVAASSDGDSLDAFDGLNATACSFYSSQGNVQNLPCSSRLDSAFDDRNEHLVEDLAKTHPDVHTVEMETFHLLDLAQRSRGSIQATAAVLVVANRITGKVVESDVLATLESFWGQVILEALADTPLQV
ncbi:hypothetical protein ON010_g12311 [Phytophthora cinnamomi]|nr:hypothetical protein ON010_g12311 [Phytophthora cinnamomi]